MAVASYGQIRAKLSPIGNVKAVLGIGTKGGGGGSKDYRDLSNKPSINGRTLIGDSDFEDIGLGTAAAKDSTNAVTADSTDLVESGAVKSAIDAAVESIIEQIMSLDANNTEY